MSIMATKTTAIKMKQQPSPTVMTTTTTATEFLSGDGVDLSVSQKQLTEDGNATGDQDDLDLFLSEITVQFDDEVQTLYVGPVEIVDDDDDDIQGGRGDGTSIGKSEDPEEVLVQAKEEIADQPEEPSIPAEVQEPVDEVVPDDVTVDLPATEVDEASPSSLDAVDAALASSASQPEEESNSQQEQPSLPPTVEMPPPPTPPPSLPPTSPSQPAEGGEEDVEPEEETVVSETAEEEEEEEPPSNTVGVVVEQKVQKEAKEDHESDSANDDRLHHLTAAGVDIDPKNGAAEQPVASEALTTEEPDPTTQEPLLEPEVTAPVTPTEELPTLEEEPPTEAQETQPESPAESVASQPEAPIIPLTTPCTEPEEPPSEVEEPYEEEPQLPTVETLPPPATTPPPSVSPSPRRSPPSSPPKSPKKTPRKVTIKEEVKQLSPVLPSDIEETSIVNKLEVGRSQLQDKEDEVNGDEEEEENSPEGELIVPDVLAPEAPYEKDSSPAGSDSGIENEGTDLSKVASTEEEEGVVGEETVEEEEHIPEGELDGVTDEEGRGDLVESENTQVVVLEEIVIQGPQGTLIQCAKCAMCFSKQLWYKKHLMNYHGIDLSNIAHFLSNLQTLDEGIQDGDGTPEQDFEGFPLEEEALAEEQDGGNNDATDKTEQESEGGSKRKSEEYVVQAVKRVRGEDAPSTLSPATVQMYPEVKLSTSNGKPKAARRRKEELILINSDADMRIKHEYAPVATHSEESTSGSSQASQPLMNNMYVVRYLERAALMVGSSGTAEGSSLSKESSKFGQSNDPLTFEEIDDGMTPFERSKIVEITEGEKPTFTCSICETDFEDRQMIQEHVNIVHKDVKRRSCPHCGRTFNQTGDLTRHVRIHTGIRPFKCPYDGCEYAFISSGDLHKHVRRHNQTMNPIPKPHICNVCGKDFERGYDLKRHSSMHAKDDPNFQGFNCELCGKMFARKDQYRAHTYRHIGYKPHKCTQCDKTFSDASNYAKHVKVHAMDGVELYCHHCEKAFKNKMAISKHVLRCKYKAATRETSSSPKRKRKPTDIKQEKVEPEEEAAAPGETLTE